MDRRKFGYASLISRKAKIARKRRTSKDYDAEAFILLNKSRLNSAKSSRSFNNISYLSNTFKVKIPDNLTKKYVEKFVHGIYEKNLNKIVIHSEKVKKKWEIIEDDFFNLVKDIYKRDYYLKKKYILFPSLWNSFIRDFSNRRISFPYSGKIEKSIFVVSHELLHIIFYQYLYKNHPKIRNIIESKKVWDFSEVINVIIQSQEKWVNLFSIKPGVYTEHMKLYKKMNEFWKKKQDIDELIKKYLY